MIKTMLSYNLKNRVLATLIAAAIPVGITLFAFALFLAARYKKVETLLKRLKEKWDAWKRD